MTTPFEREKRRIQQEYQKYLGRLQEERREAEAGVKSKAREQLSELERRQQELLGQIRAEEQRRKKMLAIGKRMPKAPLEAEKRRIESETKVAQTKVGQAQKEALAEIEKAAKEPVEELEKWQRESIAAIEKAEAEFQSENVQLDTGEWVPREDFTELPKDYQERLEKLGVEKFNEMIAEEQAEAEEEQEETLAEFQADHVKLDTGEWVSKEEFEALDPQLQLLLKKEGVEEFMEEMEKREAKFKAEHVEVDEGKWIQKETWESLSADAQARIRKMGWDDYVSRQEDIMKDLVHEGWAELDRDADPELPPLYRMKYDIGSAMRGGYDIKRLKEVFGEDAVMDTQREIYNAPLDEVEEKFKKYLTPGQQKHFIGNVLVGNIFGIVLPIEGWADRSLKDLTEKERRQVLARFAEVRMPLEDKWREGFEEFRSHLMEEYVAPTLIAMTPVVGTIYYWDDMSPTWRAISIATDIAAIGSFARAGIGALRAAKSPIKTAAANLAKAERAATAAKVSKLRSAYGKAVAKAYTKFSNTQTKFLERMAKHTEYAKSKAGMREATKISRLQSQLEAARKARKTTLANQLQRQIDNTRLMKGEKALTKLEAQLRSSANKLAGQLKPKAGFDSPEVARMMDSLADDAVRNTKAAIRSLGRTDVKALQAAVDKAEKALKAAQAKHPTDPSKWVDLLYDYATAQGKLAQVQTGAVDAIYSKLLAARKAGKTAEVAKLEKQLRNAINAMEIEWAKGGFLTRGGGGVAVETKPWSPSTTMPPKIKSPRARATLPAAIAAKMIVSPALGKEEVTEVEPMVTATPETIVSPDIITEADVKAVAETAPRVEGVTDAEIKTIAEATVKAATDAMIKELTEAQIKAAAKTAAQAQVKMATRAQVKTVVKTGIKQAYKIYKKWWRLAERRKKKRRLKERQVYPQGTITWKMGELKRGDEWKIIPPGYTLKKPISSTQPPKGVKVTDGTPQQTLTFIGGKTPFKNVTFDLGIVDGYIDVKKKKIHFTGEGEKTNIGKRVDSPTKGISIPGVAAERRPSVKRKKRKKPKKERSLAAHAASFREKWIG